MRATDHASLSSAGKRRMKDVPWKRVGHHLPVWNSTIVPSSDVRSSKTSAQNTLVKLSKSSRVQIFTCVQIFTVLYFIVLIFAFCLWIAKIAKIVSSILGTDQEQTLHCILEKGKEAASIVWYRISSYHSNTQHCTCTYQGSVIMHLSILCPTTPHQDR